MLWNKILAVEVSDEIGIHGPRRHQSWTPPRHQLPPSVTNIPSVLRAPWKYSNIHVNVSNLQMQCWASWADNNSAMTAVCSSLPVFASPTCTCRRASNCSFCWGQLTWFWISCKRSGLTCLISRYRSSISLHVTIPSTKVLHASKQWMTMYMYLYTCISVLW